MHVNIGFDSMSAIEKALADRDSQSKEGLQLTPLETKPNPQPSAVMDWRVKARIRLESISSQFTWPGLLWLRQLEILITDPLLNSTQSKEIQRLWRQVIDLQPTGMQLDLPSEMGFPILNGLLWRDVDRSMLYKVEVSKSKSDTGFRIVGLYPDASPSIWWECSNCRIGGKNSHSHCRVSIFRPTSPTDWTSRLQFTFRAGLADAVPLDAKLYASDSDMNLLEGV